MNADILHIDLTESMDGHALIISVPRFQVTIETLLFRAKRWRYFRDFMHRHTDRTLLTPLFSVQLQDWHDREQEPKVDRCPMCRSDDVYDTQTTYGWRCNTCGEYHKVDR